jgi:hypothetical protein
MSDVVHGGTRQGAGRPKSEPTKMVRVPLGAEGLVKDLIKAYKEGLLRRSLDGSEAKRP